MKPFFLIVAVAILTCFVTVGAEAQISNQPYAFPGSSVGNNVGFNAWSPTGISPAYRELILERKLLGRSSSNAFLMGPYGTLFNVQRSGSEAFPSAVAAPFIASAINSVGLTLDGFTIGGFGYSIGGGGGFAPVRGSAPGAVPIDSWINQLNFMPNLS